jgi:hypothetical protein
MSFDREAVMPLLANPRLPPNESPDHADHAA